MYISYIQEYVIILINRCADVGVGVGMGCDIMQNRLREIGHEKNVVSNPKTYTC